MKITVDRRALAEALSLAQRVASVAPHHLVRLDAADEELRISAFNPDMRLDQVLPTRVDRAGSLLVDVAGLLRPTKAMVARTFLDIEQRDAALAITVPGAECTLLRTQSPEDWIEAPAFEAREEVHFDDAAALARVLTRVLPHASSDPERVGLCGVYLDGSAAPTRLVTTNGHTMVYAEVGGEAPSRLLPVEACALLIVALKRPADGVSLQFEEGWMRVVVQRTGGDLTLRARLPEGEFPAYREILLDGRMNCEACLVVDRSALRQACMDCAGVAQYLVFDVRDDVLHVNAAGSDARMHEEIPVRLDGHSWPRASFDARLLARLLEHAPDEVTLRMDGSSHLSVVFLDWPDGLGAIMPCRLD